MQEQASHTFPIRANSYLTTNHNGFLSRVVTEKVIIMTGEEVIRVGILKLGCIGAAGLIEYVLDELAERKDIEVR